VAVATVDIQVNSQGAVRNLNQVSAASKATASAVDGVKNAVTGLVGAFTVASTIKFVFAKTAELETQTKSLQVLTGSVKEAKAIIQELQQLGAVTPFTSTELIDSAKRLNAFGVEGNKVVETTRRLADVAGATGAELQGLVTAYGQVQAKGRLQGEELLQFQERGIALQGELRKMYGMTGDEFQKALSKGRISAEAVQVAIQRLTDTGGKYANGAIAQSETLQGKFSTLMDGVDGLARGIGTVLAPTIRNVLNLAIMGINAINTLMASGRSAAFSKNLLAAQTKLGAGALGVDPALKDTQNLINQLQGSKQKNLQGAKADLQTIADIRTTLQSVRQREMTFNLTKIGRETIGTQFQQLRDLERAANAAVKAAQVKQQPTVSNAIPALLGETGGAKRTKKGPKAKDFTEQIANSGTMLDLARSQFDIEGKILEARVAENTQLVLNLEAQKQLLRVNADIAKIKTDKDMPAARKKTELDILAVQASTINRQLNFDIAAFQKQAVDTYPEYIAGIMSASSGYSAILEYSKQLTVEQQKQKELADGVANTVGQGMTSAFDALISGSENFGASLRNIASGVLKDIAMQLLRIYVINQAINAISSFFGPKTSAGAGFGGFNPASFSMGSLSGGLTGVGNFSSAFVPKALGGPVSAGSSYMVGERGPELFTPKHGGSIVPNNALGGGSTSVVVNVDASGNSNVQGDQAQAKQLGVAVSAAVQAELVKQQRPGGLLAGTRR
jgi:tape measure domain-containing protein